MLTKKDRDYITSITNRDFRAPEITTRTQDTFLIGDGLLSNPSEMEKLRNFIDAREEKDYKDLAQGENLKILREFVEENK